MGGGKRSASAASSSEGDASLTPKAAKRGAAASASSPKAAAARRTGGPPKISNKDAGQLIRTPEALAALNTKKSKEEIWDTVIPFERRTADTDFDAARMYKFITWNVAGLRGLLKKTPTALTDFMAAEKPDVLCLQETKLNVDEAAANAALGVVDGYAFVDHPCGFKRGYSGTRTYLRTSTMVERLHARCTRGFSLPLAAAADASSSAAGGAAAAVPVEGAGDEEGRVLTTFLSADPSSPAASRIALINTYVANSGMDLARLPYRIQSFDPSMRAHLQQLDAWAVGDGKAAGSSDGGNSPHGFIWTGDLNVAERDFDRYYSGTFKTMQECSGFAPEERQSFRDTMQATQSIDVFRQLYPQAGPVYSFWSQRIGGRPKNLGWRLDYFVVSARLAPFVVDCFPMPTVMGSDHCPFQLWMRHP